MLHSFCARREQSISGWYISVFVACKAASSPFCVLVVPKGLPPRTAMAYSYYKMKGIFKGFRIISNIFAAKEPEMEIGRPTDVKHVAHIGWNSSTGTLTGNAPPSWMNGIGGSSSDLSALANFALAAPSAATSWDSQASEITGQQDAAEAQPCRPDAPRPSKKMRRGTKRTAAGSQETSSSVSNKETSASASAADAVGASDVVMQ